MAKSTKQSDMDGRMDVGGTANDQSPQCFRRKRYKLLFRLKKQTKTFLFKKSVPIVFIVYRQGLTSVAVGKIATLRVYQVTEPSSAVKLLAGFDIDRDQLSLLMSYVVV